jgi:hypothetical protein
MTSVLALSHSPTRRVNLRTCARRAAALCRYRGYRARAAAAAVLARPTLSKSKEGRGNVKGLSASMASKVIIAMQAGAALGYGDPG